ncbi:MAG: hypothetical protein V3W33_02195 [Gammaproteobacteria bacterium]
MVEQSTKQAADPTATDVRMMGGMKEGAGPMAMCPMAKACMGMTVKPPSGFLLMFPGALLVVVGVPLRISSTTCKAQRIAGAPIHRRAVNANTMIRTSEKRRFMI